VKLRLRSRRGATAFAVVVTAASIVAGPAGAVVGKSATTIVSFTIAGSGVVGSGLLQDVGTTDAVGNCKLSPAATKNPPTIAVSRGVFGTKRVQLQVTAGSYLCSKLIPGALVSYLRLLVTVRESDDASCPVGQHGVVEVTETTEDSRVKVSICGQEENLEFRGGERIRASVGELRCPQSAAARPGCSLLAQSAATGPTTLTLTVNGWTVTATKAKPAAYVNHREDQPLASETALTIRATLDHPLPKGWKLIVYRTGDPLSPGNGVYYKVCEVDSPSTATSCRASRPGRIGPFDDTVFASLSAPTYLAMHSDIDIHFNAP
jgi:hypothetical protein